MRSQGQTVSAATPSPWAPAAGPLAFRGAGAALFSPSAPRGDRGFRGGFGPGAGAEPRAERSLLPLAAAAKASTERGALGGLFSPLTFTFRKLVFHTVCLIIRGLFEIADFFLTLFATATRALASAVRLVKGGGAARQRVVIVGGSFAGLAVARNLRKDFDVTIIDRKDYFEYTPGVLRLLVRPEAFPHLTAPLASLRGVTFVHGAAEDATEGGQGEGKGEGKGGAVSVRRRGSQEAEMIPYDFLVLGCGSSYCIDFVKASFGDVDCARRQVTWTQQAERVQAAQSFLVVGGGPVGVELAAEVRSHMPEAVVTIVESKQELCLDFAVEKTRKHLNSWLKSNDIEVICSSRCSLVTKHSNGAHTVSVTRSKRADPAAPPRSSELLLLADVVFWCGGMSSDTKRLQLQLGDGSNGTGQSAAEAVAVGDGCVPAPRGATSGFRVRPSMQVAGSERVFALGDVAYLTEGVQDVKLGHAAEVQSRAVCDNVRRIAGVSQGGGGEGGKLSRHVASGEHTVYCLSMGQYDGSMRMGPVVINGLAAAVLKWVVEWTKVAQARDRPIGRVFWYCSDLMTWYTLDRPPKAAAKP